MMRLWVGYWAYRWAFARRMSARARTDECFRPVMWEVPMTFGEWRGAHVHP